MSLSRDIFSTYCALAPETIDPAALEAAKIALADGLAVMIAAKPLEPSTHAFARHALAMGPGPCTLIGYDAKVTPPMAALANGALAHALDFEDTFEPGMIHPNASLIPAVLALAQSEKASGQSVLGALVIGCDFACRIALALYGDPAERGWYHPPIVSGLGATLGCSALLGLDAGQTNDALGLFAAQFMLNDELKRSAHSHLRAVREGFAARAAVEAALLARNGVRAVEAPLDGKSGVFALLTGRPPIGSALTGELGERFYGPEVAIKRWPACRGTHSAIIAARDLHSQGIEPDDIASVAVTATPPNDMLFEPHATKIAPKTPIDAKFSIPFVFASALVGKAITLKSFAPAMLKNVAIRNLAGKVGLERLEREAPFDAIYAVTLHDGTRHSIEIGSVSPWLARDITLDALWPKVADCMAASGAELSLEGYFCAVQRVGEDGIAPLMALL